MKYIIPVVQNNSYPFNEVEFFIEDDDTLSIDTPHTVTLAVRSVAIDTDDGSLYTTVKAADLIKALEWLKRWA